MLFTRKPARSGMVSSTHGLGILCTICPKGSVTSAGCLLFLTPITGVPLGYIVTVADTTNLGGVELKLSDKILKKHLYIEGRGIRTLVRFLFLSSFCSVHHVQEQQILNANNNCFNLYLLKNRKMFWLKL